MSTMNYELNNEDKVQIIYSRLRSLEMQKFDAELSLAQASSRGDEGSVQELNELLEKFLLDRTVLLSEIEKYK